MWVWFPLLRSLSRPASTPSEPIVRPEFLPAGLRIQWGEGRTVRGCVPSPAAGTWPGAEQVPDGHRPQTRGLSPRARRCPGRFARRGFMLRWTTVPGWHWPLAPAQPGRLSASQQRRQTRSGGTHVPSRFLRASVAAGAPGEKNTFVGVGKVCLSLWEPGLGHPPFPPPPRTSVPPAAAPGLCGDSAETAPTPRGTESTVPGVSGRPRRCVPPLAAGAQPCRLPSALTCSPRRRSRASACGSAARSGPAAGTRPACCRRCPPCATPPRSAPVASDRPCTRMPGPPTLSWAQWGRSTTRLLAPPQGPAGPGAPRAPARSVGTWRAGSTAMGRAERGPPGRLYTLGPHGGVGRALPHTPAGFRGEVTWDPSLCFLLPPAPPQQDALRLGPRSGEGEAMTKPRGPSPR